MTRQTLVLIGCVLLAAASPAAQSRDSKANPITGTWTGMLVPKGETSGLQVTLELKLDAKGTVTGTIAGFSNPGDVKTGTFDAKTGALKLQLGKTGESEVLLTLDGKVAKGTAGGSMSGELGIGEFKLTKKP
jgi:hypothetical protein